MKPLSPRRYPEYRLEESAVLEIRQLRAEGNKTTVLALKYGVSPTQISRIARGVSFPQYGGQRTLTEELPRRVRTPEGKTRIIGPVPPAIVVELRKLRAEGKALRGLAARYGLGVSIVSRIVRGDTYPDVGGPRTRAEDRDLWTYCGRGHKRTSKNTRLRADKRRLRCMECERGSSKGSS